MWEIEEITTMGKKNVQAANLSSLPSIKNRIFIEFEFGAIILIRSYYNIIGKCFKVCMYVLNYLQRGGERPQSGNFYRYE